MGGGSPTYNYPEQPSYGEGMADALKAQVELLTGTGDFAKTGSLESLLPLEESIRKKTAQTDSDILRQTLLGSEKKINVVKDPKTGKYGIPGGKVVKDLGGGTVSNRFQVIERPVVKNWQGKITDYGGLAVVDVETGAISRPSAQEYMVSQGLIEKVDDKGYADRKGGIPDSNGNLTRYRLTAKGAAKGIKLEKEVDRADSIEQITKLGNAGDVGIFWTATSDPRVQEKVPNDFFSTWYKDKTGGVSEGELETSFNFTNPNTGEPFDISQGKEITIREGDGMVDLLGDRRTVSEFTTRQATQEDVNAGLASEVGESITEATGGRKAGFDADGNFLGLSALAEDIQRGNLSRQREADLADVERLSDRYQGVMEDYRPAATSGLDDARLLLEQQRENLTGLRKATQADVDQGLATEVDEMIQTGTGSGGPVTIPKDDTYGGDVTAATMTAAEVADPLQLTANTQFQGELATGAGNDDTLRSALLGDAKTALDTGLTDREQAQIANAARARQTLMGRTFDQSGAIAEAEARVQEDNARRMQNRSFAQSVLGQEAGLQQGDITRGMAQQSEQAGLQQRADLTQAQMDQQANAFGAQSTQQARMANQAQRQQANQFGVGAEMDAERLNETLRQQGLANYINAVGNLARMEDQYMLDPFQALLGRGGGGSLQAGQSVFGQAGYGLNSGPQYLNPEAGLGYISNMAANQANMYAANVAGDASRTAGIFGGLGALGGGALGGLLSNEKLFCWVAREVYGPTNPAWMQFREWMFTESPQWFFELYRKYGERFASWISDKPRLKGIIRKWMDSKIGDK